jgi:hypothetical protein
MVGAIDVALRAFVMAEGNDTDRVTPKAVIQGLDER